MGEPRAVSADDHVGPLTQAAALGLASGLFGMGVLLFARPRLAWRIFGLPAPEREALDVVRALSFRDFGVAAALALASGTSRPALTAVSASLAIIPAADMALVARRRGSAAAPSMLLHAVSGAALLIVAAAARRRRA
jgi:hypothetical protein